MALFKKISNNLKSRYLSSTNNWDGIDVSLVTGTGRIGTMFFKDFFTLNFEDTLAYHEPWPDLHDIGYNYHHNKYSEERAIDIIKRERSEICADLNKREIKNYLESNYNLSYLLPFLKPVFGDFKLVHIIREPKSQLQSIFSVKEAKRHIYAEFDNRNRITAPDFPNDPFANQWENWSRFEKLCWHYYKVNTMLGDYVENNPNAITVRFDEIFDQANDYQGLFKIADFINAPMKEGVTKSKLLDSLSMRSNKTKKKGIQTYDNWSDSQKESFHLITDPVAKRFGFI